MRNDESTPKGAHESATTDHNVPAPSDNGEATRYVIHDDECELGKSGQPVVETNPYACYCAKLRRLLEAAIDMLGPRCDRCSRPLSDPKSVECGRGPVCRKGEHE